MADRKRWAVKYGQGTNLCRSKRHADEIVAGFRARAARYGITVRFIDVLVSVNGADYQVHESVDLLAEAEQARDEN